MTIIPNASAASLHSMIADHVEAGSQVITDGKRNGSISEISAAENSDFTQARRPVRRDGFSLVEIVITIALLGTVVVGVVAAVQGTIRASMTARHSAQIQTVLLNAADRVNRSPKGCGFMNGADYEAHYLPFVMAAVSLQWGQGYAGEVTVRERHYVPPPALPGNSNLDTSGTWSEGACALNVPQPLEVQLVTITIMTPDQKFSRSIEVVKSDV